MKKILGILLSTTLVFSLAACGDTTTGNVSEPLSTQETTAGEIKETAGKTLVVFFSASGNTEKAANYIAEITEGDLFELEPITPYTEKDLNYNDANSRVSQEHENETQRNVELKETTVENWSKYDTVFIGYPIWWGIAAWPVNQFVENNDFTGKTVIPFATSVSSDFGESGELLEQIAETGEWQDGHRFSSGVSESDVQAWIDELGIGF